MATILEPALKPSVSRFSRSTKSLLDFVERAGNILPHPATLFVILAGIVIVASGVAANFNLSVQHPGTGETVRAVSLLSVEGLHRMLTSLVSNFVSFAPLGTVLVAILGTAIAEKSGLIGAALKMVVLSAPKRLLTSVVVLAGVLSHTASDLGYVLLIPLAAMIFHAVGRHPLAGLAAAFAGVSGGFNANLLLSPLDPLLAGITQEAAHIVDRVYQVNAMANYYFLAVSAIVITIIGTIVTEKIIEPRLGKYTGGAEREEMTSLTPIERRGLKFALGATIVFAGVLLWGTVPADGFLRNPQTGSLLQSPFMSSIVALLFIGAFLIGLAYGIGARTLRNDTDIVDAMTKSVQTMGLYIVLVFFAAQFIAYFNWTNLGLILAVNGAEALRTLELSGVVLIISFVVLCILIDLVIGSAAAKWAIMAPVFVPMMMLLGFSPELTQAGYRVGDSVANIITPMMAYFPLIVAFAQKYEPQARIGTIMATMLPYSVAFFIVWTLLLIVWYYFGIPLGPGASMHYTPHP